MSGLMCFEYLSFSCIKFLEHHFLEGRVRPFSFSSPFFFTYAWFLLVLVLLFREGSSCWAAVITGWWTLGRLRGTWAKRQFLKRVRFCSSVFFIGKCFQIPLAVIQEHGAVSLCKLLIATNLFKAGKSKAGRDRAEAYITAPEAFRLPR